MTEPITLRPFAMDDAEALLGLRLKNRAFLTAFEPRRPTNAFTLSAQREQIASDEDAFAAGRRFAFAICTHDALVGRVSLDNVVRGAWQNATLGYFVDHDHNGRGIATEAVRQAVDYAFTRAGLHRVQAGVMPRNVASIRVLEKVGFRYEGSSLRYLQINGLWEDHNIYAITSEEWGPGARSAP